jgi:hypothetical protein
MQAAVGELHLRLDTDSVRDAPVGYPAGQIVQQRALTRARFATEDDNPAPTGEYAGQSSVKYLALGVTTEKHLRLLGIEPIAMTNS